MSVAYVAAWIYAGVAVGVILALVADYIRHGWKNDR